MRVPLTNVNAGECLAAYLIDKNIVQGTTGWDIFVSSTPTTPDNIVVIRNTGARIKSRLMRSGEMVKGHRVQVSVRCLTYPTGFAKAIQIENAFLLGIRNVELTVTDFQGQDFLVDMESFTILSPVTEIGMEENNLRRLFTLNGLLTAREIH